MATPLILLHGLGTGPSGWLPQVEAFARDREVAVPQLPLDVDAAVASVLGALEARRRADLCGLSYGALVALRTALERPASVRRLVLTAAFARLPRRLRALQTALATAARFVPNRIVVDGLTAGVPLPHRAEASRELADVSRRDIVRLMRAATRFDAADAARSLHVPTLVLCGERDVPNLELSRQLAALLPCATFRLVPGAGHVANLEAPEPFTALVRSFLDERRGDAPVT